jgi:hypothetical protein
MFVYLPRCRYALFAACTLATAACDAPVLSSDLRPDGPPEVLTVSVNAPDNRDGFAGGGGSLEQVTFCKTQGPNDGAAGAGDPKRPDEVILSDESALELCDTDSTKPVAELTNALPEVWYARVQFDELLDPSIEDLIPDVDDTGMPIGTFTGTLKNTQPVTLKCDSATGAGQVDVPYDGYYSPAGSSISYPLGPSLVIIPTDPTVVATDSECTITLKSNITDKDGNQVPADQIGPYKFRVGAIEVLIIDPTSADSKQDPIAAGVDLTFNTAVDPVSLAGDAGPPVVPAAFAFTPTLPGIYVQPESAEEYFIGADFPVSGGPYTFTLLAGAKLVDQCGKATTLAQPSVNDMTQTSLTTNALKLNSISGAVEPGAMINIAFNQYMDVKSLLPAEFTITPAVTCQDCVNAPNVDVEPSPSGNILIHGNFQLGTAYTFTLNANATIDDCPGAEFAACAKSTTYTATAAQPVPFMTAPAILLKTISLKDNATESSDDSAAGITLTFNQEMDPATFVQGTDYTLSPNVALVPGPGSSYEKIDLVPAAPLPPGTYTFTLLHSGSTSDLVQPTANTFSPSADQVIHFTVTPNPTSTPHTCL